MFKFLKQYFLLSVLFGVVSCTSKNNLSNLKSIDSLIVIADSVMMQITHFYIDTLNVEFEKIKKHEKAIQSNIDSFSRDSIVKRNLMILGRVHKSYKNFIKNYNTLLSESAYSVKQLSDLKKDVSSNMVKDEEFRTYFEQEKEELQNLSINVSFYFKDMVAAKKLYLQEINSIDSCVNYLKNKK